MQSSELIRLIGDLMVVIRSFSVGNGDMFYIKHDSDSFTIINCYLNDENGNKKAIVNEIKNESKAKNIHRFISTHPDDDHVGGLDYLDDEINIVNFYCVKNEATKTDPKPGFMRYCKLRDSDKAFCLHKGCSRKWLNDSDSQRGSVGISILWPDVENEFYQKALKDAKNGKSPNNISPIIKYSLNNGVTAIWMGDLETDFMENIKSELALPQADILFAPHHGRDTGKAPKELLDVMKPKIIIVGEAPSEHLNYYPDYNTITQNSAGDITFDCHEGEVDIYPEFPNFKHISLISQV
jgi:beta-lactamase superfamily II metal-dependent hydrolase